MTATAGNRFYVVAPDGASAIGRDLLQSAVALARELGEGAHIVDTQAMPYEPMCQRIDNGEPVYVEFGAWDTRGALEQNLVEAVKKGYAPIVRAFLAKGANPAAIDRHGGCALIWAVARGKADIVRLLLDAGADVNAADAEGTTALKLARRQNKTAIADLLTAAGAKA